MDLSLSLTPKISDMERLAESFISDETGVFNHVSTDRLSARIPVIMLTARVDDGHVEIDLSPKNVLAVVNTK